MSLNGIKQMGLLSYSPDCRLPDFHGITLKQYYRISEKSNQISKVFFQKK